MSRHKKHQPQPSPLSSLAQETLYSIFGLLFLALAIVLVLAAFSKAGNAGEFSYRVLFYLVGWGYVFLPITLLGLSANFLINKREAPSQPTVWTGAGLFLFSVLGLLEVFARDWGGFIGLIAGYPQNWLGAVAWGIILFIVALISILIAVNRPLHLKLWRDKEVDEHKPHFAPIPEQTNEKQKPQTENKKEEAPEKTEDDDIIIAEPKKKGAPSARPFSAKFADYKAPPLDLLKSSVEKPSAGDLRANANIIKRTLESFGIPVEMGEINIGPKVTRYTLRPAEGIKLSRITALNPDLALALSAHPIRIEAPIPGRPYVGIEVPNKSAAVVRLGNIISYPEFNQAGAMGFALGRDVTGEPLFANIEKMPHLLIAGATGSGKSITLHSVLISLLYKNSPQMLRLALIDPKRVELSAYNKLPHLIAPVITQGKKALGVFRWAISEMDQRYEILLKAGARDIQSYNKKNPEAPLPFILIVVDEMADLMAAFGRDIENAIVRLAQMARATGIHLILSTQRPSVEVITGLIKANITSRIALQVASQIDSRTILDTAGAEKLLGGGDLLFVSAELSKPRRLQGAFISEEEIKGVTDFIRDNNKDLADDTEVTFTNHSEEEPSELGLQKDMFSEFETDGNDDDMLEEAIEVVKQTQKASASFLQRRLRVGYARAARLLDLMEERGVVGPGEGAKPREVYVTREEGAAPVSTQDSEF